MSNPNTAPDREVIVYLIADFIGAYSPAAEVYEAARYPARRNIDTEVRKAIWTFASEPGAIILEPDAETVALRQAWEDAGHRRLGQGDVIVVDGRAYTVTAAGYRPITFDAQRQVVTV